MFKKILIANRGEIACRVIKTAKEMGITTVAIYSDADVNALHVKMADEAFNIGPAPANQSYINMDKVIAAVQQSGAQAVHPGYGFLSENPLFPAALAKIGVTFIGPPIGAIEAMGDKITSKKLAQEAGVTTVPGHMDLIEDADEAVKIANQITYPVMIKASAGGGGKGMRIAWNDEQAREGFQASKNEAANSFGDDRIFIEKFITQPRHIEIQVLGDTHGNCIYLGERECSIQRRNQKIIEEAPSPFLDEATRAKMGAEAVALAKAVDYCSAGTVEFIVDGDKNFYFLEMNTRLQVEHPVTELVTNIDLVEQMIRIADGEKLSLTQDEVTTYGWAMESRLYAEDPYRNFLPSIGRLSRYRPPEEGHWETHCVRNDTGVYEGGEISIFYDPMIAKLCTWAPNRADAIAAMRDALDGFEIDGISHNLPFLSAVMGHPRFISGEITTAFIEEEFPDGFSGVTLPDTVASDIAAIACAMHLVTQNRIANGHGRKIGHNWVAHYAGNSRPLWAKQDGDIFYVGSDTEHSEPVELDWHPGERICRAYIGKRPYTLKVSPRRAGFEIHYRGADLDIMLLTPRQSDLMALMPEKVIADTSNLLLCPMPGVLVGLNVQVGDTVQEGQALATVEAMKMENILRAEKSATVTKVNFATGDSLAVDEIILEFGE